MSDISEVKQIDNNIAEKLSEIMNPGEKISTRQLNEKLVKEQVGSESYVKQRLYIHRDWFPQQVDNLETFKEEDNTGGEDTRYWRIKQ
jgi:hypothetical protein